MDPEQTDRIGDKFVRSFRIWHLWDEKPDR